MKMNKRTGFVCFLFSSLFFPLFPQKNAWTEYSHMFVTAIPKLVPLIKSHPLGRAFVQLTPKKKVKMNQFNINPEYIMKSSTKIEKCDSFSWAGPKLKALT